MNKERLKNGLEKMGIAADETALDRFEAFHAILDEYNARMDLTAVLDEDERVDRHDLDSAAESRRLSDCAFPFYTDRPISAISSFHKD